MSPLGGQSCVPSPSGWRWDHLGVYPGPNCREMVLGWSGLEQGTQQTPPDTSLLPPADCGAVELQEASTPEQEMAPDHGASDHHPGQEAGERGRAQAGSWGTGREPEQPPTAQPHLSVLPP